ncbi:MAG: serine hydrolase [Cyanobacteria bacterium P01_H01_bin.15]
MVQISLFANTDFPGDPTRLVESEGTLATLILTADELLPPEGATVTLISPNLAEFEVNQIQVDGADLSLSDGTERQLEDLLASKLAEVVPGVAIASVSPFGEWSGRAGLANIETNTPVSTGDRFEVGSITKVFTATTLLKLVEDELLSLDDLLTDWLPESVTVNVPNAEEITIRQLLNHTSGVPEYDFILLERGMSNPFVFLRDWQPEEIVELIAEQEPFFAPGTGWQYANTNFVLAGLVIEAATNSSLGDEITTRVINPLGLDNTFFSTVKDAIPGGYISGYLDFDQNGVLDDVSISNLSWTWAAGAIVSNTDDLIRLAQALYNGDFLANATRSEMFTLVDTGRGYEYGLGMMSFDTPDLGRIVGHRGGSLGFNSNMWYSLDTGFTYVELLNGRTEEALVTDTIPSFQSGPLSEIVALPSEFRLTLTEQVAELRLPVANDGEVEPEETVTFGLETSDNISTNPEAQGITLYISDSQDTVSMQLPDRVITALDEALDANLPVEVPGAVVALLTPEGDWFGASGVSDLAAGTTLQPNDRFEAGSVTKTFVATTILQLFEEDALALDDTLTELLPTNVTNFIPNAEEITVEQILNHTSGIADFLDPLTTEAGSGNFGLFFRDWAPTELLGYLIGVDPFFEPGTDWQYSNTNYILAGLVIESVTGNNYGSEIRDRIIDPLGLENTFVFGEEEIPGGYIKGYLDANDDGVLDDISITNLSWAGAAGSIISNAEDLADFFEGLLVDDALLAPETLALMLDTIPVESPNYDSYGLGIGGLGIPDSPNSRFWYAHRGQTLGFRTNLWYSPAEEITYVELLNGRSSSNLVSDIIPTYRRTITPPTPDFVTFQFDWTGQIAEFSVEGEFSYDLNSVPDDGIIREENLESFDISFFDPAGNLLRTYLDNHLTFPEFNFAFDTNTIQILTDGVFTEPDGLNVGEKTAVGEDSFTGLNLWSKSRETSPSLIHVDDWSGEFGFPLGYSTHEDIAFLTRTTQELIDTGNVGETYLEQIQDSLDQLGQPINVFTPPNQLGTFEVASGFTSLFLNFSLFETAGLVIQDANRTAEPFSNQFQLAYAIDDSTNFRFESNPFAPSIGSINHTGDITFLAGGDTLITLGDFAIRFDPERIGTSDGSGLARSGFFVSDTLDDPLNIDVLFDIAEPGRLIVQENTLTIADADLLLAPELAEILGLVDFVGSDIGDARIDAQLTLIDSPVPVVSLVIEPESVSEEDAPLTTQFRFIVDGEIPEGGLPILFGAEGSDLIDILGQLDANSPQELIGMESLGFFPAIGAVGLNLLQNEAVLTRTIANDVIEEADRTFEFKIVPNDDRVLDSVYVVSAEAGSDTLTLTDDNGGPGVGPQVGLSVSDTTLMEGDELTVSLTVDGDIPAEGLTVLVRGDVSGVLGEFDIFNPDETPAFTTTGIAGVPVVGDDRGSSFLATLIEPNATITLSVFDDGPDEGLESFNFEVVDGEIYEVDPAASAVALTIDDGLPVVSFSTTPAEISEAAGTALVMNFTVQGTIPDEGITVNLVGDAPRIMQQFTAAQARFDAATENIFYRFDTGLANPNNGFVVGGILDVFSLEDGDPSEVNSNPDAAGDAFLSDFSFTITEPTASITFSVLDELLEEADQSFTYTLAEGEGYVVDSAANSGTFTVVDGVTPATTPTVGVTASPTTLYESEQTVIEIVFSTVGEIPDGGVIVQLAGPPRAIAEFDVNASNPRLPDTVVEGVEVTGGAIVGTDDVAGSLLLNITEPTATVQVQVFRDESAEGVEVLPFTLIDGEAYEVDPAAAAVEVTIDDDLPVVSFSTAPALISEADGTTLAMVFNVEGAIPAEGITVNLSGNAARILQQFTVAQTRFDAETGNIFYRFDNGFVNPDNGFILGGTLDRFSLEDGDQADNRSDEAVAGDGFLSDFSFIITESTAVITIPVLDDLVEEVDQTFTYTLAEGESYRVDPNENSGTFTVTDGIATVEGPTVGVTATPTTLFEPAQTAIEVTFTTAGDIPAEGFVVQLQGPPRAIAEFDVNATNPRLPEDETVVEGVVVTGGNIVGTDEVAGSLFLRITEPTTTLTVPVFQDDVVEGMEVLPFTLVDGEEYAVDPAASAVEVTIDDTAQSAVVTVDISTTTFVEELGTPFPGEVQYPQLFTLTFTVEGDLPPDARPRINFASSEPDGLTRFSLTEAQPEGIIPIVDIENFEFMSAELVLLEDVSSLTLPVFFLPTDRDLDSDGIVEDFAFETEVVDFTLTSLSDGVELSQGSTGFAGTFFETIEDSGLPSIQSGVTSVFLDEAVLAAAGLSITNINGSAEPASDAFQVGFAMTEGTNFTYALEPFAPIGGVFEHSGDITLTLGDTDVTVGNFTVSFDSRRISDTTSGFFVADTLEDGLGLDILFDVGIPGTVAASEDELVLGDADLLLAPELAAALNLPELTGADVGDTRIDSLVEVPPIVVSLSLEPAVVSEEGEESFTFTFTVDGEIPTPEFDEDGNLISGGLPIFFDGTAGAIFSDVFENPVIDGFTFGSIVNPANNGLEFILLENNASSTLTVVNDLIQEGEESVTFRIFNDDEGLLNSNYVVNPDAASATVTIVDGQGGPGEGPTVGITLAETEVTEGNTITLTFAVAGDIPTDGLEVLVQSPTQGALGEFVIFDEDGNPAIESTGLAGLPEAADGLGNGFIATIVESTASITLAVFDDGPNEGTEVLEFALADGELYEVDSEAADVSLTINEPPSLIFGTGGPDVFEVGVNGFDGVNELIFAGDDADLVDLSGATSDTRVYGSNGEDELVASQNDRLLGGDDRDILEASVGTGGNRLYGGEGPDELIGGTNDRLFGNSGDDTFELGVGGGGNRAYGGAGDDDFFLGTGDRIVGGTGEDQVFASSGGDNRITGGADADQFWIATSELPGTPNTITDFAVGEDVLGIGGLGISFADVEITGLGTDTQIGIQGQAIALLSGIDSTLIDESSFVIV